MTGIRHLVFLAGFLTIGTAQARAQIDTALVEAVVEINIQGGPSRVVPAVSHNSTMLVPLHLFLEMTEIPLIELSRDSFATAQVQPGDKSVRFRPDSGYFTRGDSVFVLDPGEAAWWDGDLYLATAVLDRAFDVLALMEWANLSVRISRTSALPIIQRARRARRHTLLDRPGATPLSSHTARPPESVADGAVLQWSLTSPTNDPVNGLSLTTGLGARLFGGSIELRHRLKNIDGTTDTDLRTSWSRAWPDQKSLRQVSVGDVRSSGMRARLIRGAVITNAPYVRSSEFDVQEVFGRLPAGWEVELYQRGRLRGYDEVDALGKFSVPVQLRYGQNPYELVLYGPGGQVIRETRTIRVPFSRIPEGELEYAVAAGSCRYEACRGLISTDLRYGLTNRVTVQVGSDYFLRYNTNGLWQPYAAVSAAPLPFFSVTGEGVFNGRLRGSFSLEPTSHFRLGGSHTVFAEEGSAFNSTFLERRRTEASLYWRPKGVSGSLYFQLLGHHSTGPFGNRNFQRLSMTTRVGRIRHSLGLRHDFYQQQGTIGEGRTGIDWSGFVMLTGQQTWLRSTSVRGAVSLYAGQGLTKLRTSIGRQIAKKARINVGIGWLRIGGFSLDIGFNTVVSGPRFGTRNHFSSGSGTEGVMFADGSLIVDPDTRTVHLGDGRDLGRAGISGVVFLDENDNGIQDADERGLPGVPMRIGGWHEDTDAAGRFAAWDLFPYEASFIQVDQLAFDDPRLVALNPVTRVNPTPNSFLSVDVPVVVGAEVSGYVLFHGEGLAGTPVLLHNRTIGRTITLTTFSDGAFYRVSVPPGEYDVEIPDEVLERLGASANTLQINIPSGQGDKRIEDLLITVDLIPEQPGILNRLIQNRTGSRENATKGRF